MSEDTETGMLRDLQIQVWESVSCPRCSRPVAFLPGQRRNVCGWCKRKITRRPLVAAWRRSALPSLLLWLTLTGFIAGALLVPMYFSGQCGPWNACGGGW